MVLVVNFEQRYNFGLNKMATTVNQKVIPISDMESSQAEDDTPPQHENFVHSSKLIEKKRFLSERRMEKLKNLIAYSEIKASVRWLLDNASCNISISVSPKIK